MAMFGCRIFKGALSRIFIIFLASRPKYIHLCRRKHKNKITNCYIIALKLLTSFFDADNQYANGLQLEIFRLKVLSCSCFRASSKQSILVAWYVIFPLNIAPLK